MFSQDSKPVEARLALLLPWCGLYIAMGAQETDIRFTAEKSIWFGGCFGFQSNVYLYQSPSVLGEDDVQNFTKYTGSLSGCSFPTKTHQPRSFYPPNKPRSLWAYAGDHQHCSDHQEFWMADWDDIPGHSIWAQKMWKEGCFFEWCPSRGLVTNVAFLGGIDD